MDNIITTLSKLTKISEQVISNYYEQIAMLLLKEGCSSDDPRFYPYLIRRLRKRLKIKESTTYKTFKEFFKD